LLSLVAVVDRDANGCGFSSGRAQCNSAGACHPGYSTSVGLRNSGDLGAARLRLAPIGTLGRARPAPRVPLKFSHRDQEEMMSSSSFIQIMQLQTSKLDEIRGAVDEWQKATKGKRTVGRSAVCQDRDNPGRYAVVVFFDSYDDAMKNSALPETDALSKKVTALSDGPPTFVNLEIIEERIV
jgi:hypothetical protein